MSAIFIRSSLAGIMYNIRMRHISAVVFLIMILVIPWLMYHPVAENAVFSIIGAAEDQLALVILAHNPKTVVAIKSNYGSSLIDSSVSTKKVRILLVPGHEPDYGGAEYGSIKERDMTVELATQLQQYLGQNDKYQVYTTRDTNSWDPIFSDYFKTNWKDIIAWKDGHKDEIAHLTKLGDFHPVSPIVTHNDVPTDVALRLYGIGKWSNENNIDIIIHIHFNDNPGHSQSSPGIYSGFAIYVPQSQYFNSSTTQALASTIFNRLHKYNAVSNLPGESGGIIQDQDLIAIGAYNSLDAASMLIEYGYIYEPQFTNPILHDTAIKDLAFQTYLGLQDFFDKHNMVSFTGASDTLLIPHTWSTKLVDNTSSSSDIYSLQTALVADGLYPPQNKSMNDCPRTGTFGLCTKAAISDFQKKYGIVGEGGLVGPKTLDELNKLYGVKSM